MTTDSNWLKSLTESYKQEVSESARNLQEEADQIMNLVETIQTALNVDLTKAQVDALIEAFRSTVDPAGEHKPGLVRKMLGVLGGKISKENKHKQTKIHNANNAHNDIANIENAVSHRANTSQTRAYNRGTEAGLLMPEPKDFPIGAPYKKIKS